MALDGRVPLTTPTDTNQGLDTPARDAWRRAVGMLIAALALAALHVGLHFVWPRLVSGAAPLKPQLNVAVYVTNLFVLGSIVFGPRRITVLLVCAYAAGYAAVVWTLWPLVWLYPENLLLLVLALLVYGGMLRHPPLLGYLYLFLLCQRFVPAYLYPAFLLGALLYTTLGPFARALRQQREWFMSLCHVAGLILLTALLLPIIYFCTQSSAQDIHQRLGEADVLSALSTSLQTSALAGLIVLVLGVPMAYAMVRRNFPGRGLIDTLIDLPIVVPAPIAGLALLAFLGPKSPLGAFLDQHDGPRFFDSFFGIVVAQVFVGSPYLIRASMVAFAAVDERYENVGRTLGASSVSSFFRITLPLSLRGILIGLILTWFRAMAEFGSLHVMANNPKTIPILTYDRFRSYGEDESSSVAVLILLLCLGVIAGMWIIRSMPNILGRSIGASDAAR